MVGGITTTTVFSTLSPLEAAANNAVPDTEDTNSVTATATVFNPGNDSAVDPALSNSFSPAPDSSLLSQSTTEVLLTEQAVEPPAILQDLASQETINNLGTFDSAAGLENLGPVEGPAVSDSNDTEEARAEDTSANTDSTGPQPATTSLETTQQVQSFEVAAGLANGQDSTSNISIDA